MVNKSKNEIVNKVLNDKYNDNTFERIKHLDDYGNEYWYAVNYKRRYTIRIGEILKSNR